MDHNPNRLLPVSTPTHIPAGSQLTVTIGRNVAPSLALNHAGPVTRLFSFEWIEFQDVVRSALTDLVRPSMTFGPFLGRGEWEGVTEESAVFIVMTGYPASVASVEERLSRIASEFGQDAIAWSYGPNLLASRPVVAAH